MRILTIPAGVALLSFVVAGCSNRPPMGEVRGTVIYKQKPVPYGTVMFVPAKGPAAVGDIQPDGTYTLKTDGVGSGAVVGKHSVALITVPDTSKQSPEERNPLPPPFLPMKYGNTDTSGLSAEVKAGENKIDFDLK